MPGKFREISGSMGLGTATGDMYMPVDFQVVDIEYDSFAQGSDPSSDFIAPCAPIPKEFIKVEFVNDPNNNKHSIHISWAINSYRQLSWKASGFTQ